MGTAPPKETLAAALLDMAGWDSSLPLDPYVAPEPAFRGWFKSLNIAPGLFLQKFGFGWRILTNSYGRSC